MQLFLPRQRRQIQVSQFYMLYFLIRILRIAVFEAAGDGITRGCVDISSGVQVRANHGVSRAKTVLLPSTRIIHIRAAGGPLAQS